MVSYKASRKMSKPAYAALEKKEEQQHKDLDHDGEKGESLTHKAKVLGKAAPTKKAPGKPFGGKQAPNFGKSADAKMPPFLKKK